ncbi:hypothetical protein B0I35DRAFT_215553 [Stachybotrys elegans]|uniref:Uncharacterized protein n=1 Tax=Stachybotrys elegans TaxID=80388 RepID=A0A8K0SW06_9HYPO|nr:hypothetical protein B0I35DRAFT_215553 [Stachybotrys elegans]
MKFTTVANVACLATAASAWLIPPPSPAQEAVTPVEATKDIPPCGINAPQPCRCPEGTAYVYIQTWFSWGANAKDIHKLTGNFSDLSWVPQPIKITIGPDNTVGSYRLTTIHGDVGTFDWFEEITEYELKDDGSFVWAFELKNVPLAFPDGSPGRFAGEWERFQATAAGEDQTDVYWTLYGCHNGGTHTFPEFQRYVVAHVDATMKEKGLLKGTTTEPFCEVFLGDENSAPSKKERLSAFTAQDQQYILNRKGVRLQL